MTDTKYPALINPPVDPQDTASLNAWLNQVTEIIRLATGQQGKDLAFIPYADMLTAGFLEAAAGNSGSVAGGAYNPGVVGNNDPVIDLSPPPVIPAVEVTNGFSFIFLKYDFPSVEYPLYAEIWRSETDLLEDAVMVGVTQSGLYSDNVGMSSATYYYWVRLVKTSGSNIVQGAYSESVSGQGQSQLSGDAIAEGTLPGDRLVANSITAALIVADNGFFNEIGVQAIYNHGGDEGNYNMKIDLVNGFIHIR